MSVEDVLSRGAHLLTVEVRLLWAVGILYMVAAILSLYGLITATHRSGRMPHAILGFTLILHTGVILLRIFETGRAPFQTLYESLSWFSFTSAVTYLFVSKRWRRVGLPCFFVTLIASCAIFYALLGRSPEAKPLSPPLQSWWFEWHVVVAFSSYAVFVVSSAFEATYLIAKRLLKTRDYALGLAPEELKPFRTMATKLVIFGFPMLTFGIFSGAAWANEAWGRYWGWDPKETWSLITWTVFAMYLHAQSVPRWRENVASTLNLLGFVCMIMTFLGVNWLSKLLGIPSLHAYAV
ncbi:MAG TPA: c-type cytochrome biogenesis protein CcsB [Deltaproteobacteria bacterium]|nr:c-type cytochrome biogenesis protein CcsB [Deltaproteobacteria bacterium]